MRSLDKLTRPSKSKSRRVDLDAGANKSRWVNSATIDEVLTG